MEYRQLGRSGLRVPALSFGAGTFGGRGPLFSAWGSTDIAEAQNLVDLCLELASLCSTLPTSTQLVRRRRSSAPR